MGRGITLKANKRWLFSGFLVVLRPQMAFAPKKEATLDVLPTLPTYFSIIFFLRKNSIYKVIQNKWAKWVSGHKVVAFGYCPRIQNIGYNERNRMSLLDSPLILCGFGGRCAQSYKESFRE